MNVFYLMLGYLSIAVLVALVIVAIVYNLAQRPYDRAARRLDDAIRARVVEQRLVYAAGGSWLPSDDERDELHNLVRSKRVNDETIAALAERLVSRVAAQPVATSTRAGVRTDVMLVPDGYQIQRTYERDGSPYGGTTWLGADFVDYAGVLALAAR